MSTTNDVNLIENPIIETTNLVAPSNPVANPIINSLLNMSTFGMWGLWFCIGIILLLITMALESSQIIFTLYCCGAFIILMSFVTLF